MGPSVRKAASSSKSAKRLTTMQQRYLPWERSMNRTTVLNVRSCVCASSSSGARTHQQTAAAAEVPSGGGREQRRRAVEDDLRIIVAYRWMQRERGRGRESADEQL